MNTNKETDIIKGILTESINKQPLNEGLSSWVIPVVGGGLYKGVKSAVNEYEKQQNKGLIKSTWDAVTSPVDSSANIV
jgi:hypothetical protein